MTPERFQSLSRRQAECLRFVARDRGAKEIGLLLGISDETVEAHIKAALRKLGTNSRFTAARGFAEFEGRTHPVVMPTQGGTPGEAAAASTCPSYQLHRTGRGEHVLHDAAATIGTHSQPDLPAPPAQPRGARRDGLSPVHRLALAAVIAASIVIVAAAAKPLAEGFQALADIMQPRQ
ncbi:MAG TPA: helix-turn-helix transcriptional regulator [Sphingomonas sp.]|nr:helix-turn-helix transcriptional regulator [Sphingomonas sp.]